MANRRRRARQRDVNTAAAEALVRYGPQRSELLGLVRDLKGQYRGDVRSINAQTGAQIAGIRRSRPVLRKTYDTALSQADTAKADVDRAFGSLGAAADPFEAVTAREFGLNRSRVAGAKAQALSDLTGEAISARAGKQYGLLKAKSDYRSDLRSVQQKLSDLGDQQGAYITGRLGELYDKRQQRKASQKIADTYAKGKDKTDDEGIKPASRAELRSFKSNYAKAFSVATDYARGNDPRRKAARELTRGVPSSVTGSQAVPAISDQLALSVALDMAYGGHVSRANARRLHAIGISVRDLPGAKSLKQWRKANKPSTVPILGDLIGTVLP